MPLQSYVINDVKISFAVGKGVAYLLQPGMRDLSRALNVPYAEIYKITEDPTWLYRLIENLIEVNGMASVESAKKRGKINIIPV